MKLGKLPYIFFKRFQAKFFTARFCESLIKRDDISARHFNWVTIRDIAWDPLANFGNQPINLLGHEEIVRLRKLYDRIARICDLLRDDFVRFHSDYAANEIGIHSAELRIKIELFLKEKALEIFPSLPPIEDFGNADAGKYGKRGNNIGNRVQGDSSHQIWLTRLPQGEPK
ncbi:MAG: hypothetical protein ABFD98_15795 [Syntrophobacteraceae bacterium]|nr:hypothetical protein [Desulfobacteraceae bacterium]